MVVQAPAHVVCIGLAAVAPPCVALVRGVGLEAAVDILDASVFVIGQQHVHPGAFFGGEAAVLLVAAPVFQVFLAVGNVDVTAQHKLAFAFQAHQVGVHLGQKAELGGLAVFAGGAAGKVAADDGELAGGRIKARLHVSSFGIELFRVKACNHIAGLVAAVDAHARVAALLRKMEDAGHACQGVKLAGDIRSLGLDLLHANTIRAGRSDPVLHTLGSGRTNAVEVEAGQFEKGSIHVYQWRAAGTEHSTGAGICAVRRAIRRIAFWGVQDQGRAYEPLFFQCRLVR